LVDPLFFDGVPGPWFHGHGAWAPNVRVGFSPCPICYHATGSCPARGKRRFPSAVPAGGTSSRMLRPVVHSGWLAPGLRHA